ncbi:MAG: LacI family DNA-binding transcriptional regulator [Verrucomicrobiota bacterium JB024]|nr:LacI family DNA-binding transcriptional regulator [Verrucomicrobiota bacterium JB024]
MSNQRPTQRDIAKAVGVTQATVSLALGNHPRVSDKLRQKIQQIADSLGYRPDPYLAGLSAYKRTIREPNFQATLAWVTNFSPKNSWRAVSTFQHYYDGAQRRAAELGYQLESHDLAVSGMSSKRLEGILRSKNIPGVLLAPQQKHNTRLELSLKHLSAVTFGYSLSAPRLHTVTSHHYRSMETIWDNLVRLGYKRPSLVIEYSNEKRADNIPSSCFFNIQRTLSKKQYVPALIEPSLTPERFLKWYKQYQPDVIISLWEMVYPWLVNVGIKVPEDVGLVLLSVREQDGIFSGIWENPSLIGARAVEFLIELIHRRESGIPSIPSYLMVEGTWLDGTTV